MDFSGRGLVYDSAFNSFASLEKAVKLAKEAGMTDIQVVAVHNDAITAFSNTVNRGVCTGRFLSLDYFTEAFLENQGKNIEDITDDNPALQLKKRGAKGWYDSETGKVVINLSAHRDAADIVETVFHETIGHKGIEEMMGKERFERMIDEVWSHAADDVRRAETKNCSKVAIM